MSHVEPQEARAVNNNDSSSSKNNSKLVWQLRLQTQKLMNEALLSVKTKNHCHNKTEPKQANTAEVLWEAETLDMTTSEEA